MLLSRHEPPPETILPVADDGQRRCLCHVFRPLTHIEVAGTGDCTVCQPHPDNVNCRNYQPVHMTIHGYLVRDADAECR